MNPRLDPRRWLHYLLAPLDGPLTLLILILVGYATVLMVSASPERLGTLALNLALRCLDVLGEVLVDQALHDEGLEEFQSHLLRQTTLVHLQLRTNNDNGTTRVVDALTKQVLTETSLLALEHV